MSIDGGSGQALSRVCRKCSVVSQSPGDYCPGCGTAYAGRRVSTRTKLVAAGVIALLLLGGAGAGVAAKVRSDHEAAEAREAAAQRAEEKADREAAEQAAAERAADAKRAADNAAREERADLIEQMQKSITKDARGEVRDGFLDGPIFYTSCDPLGGGSVDDLTALTTTFECIAVNEKLDDGGARGYVYSSTLNWDERSWSWRLGG